jgi:hypothetical protein
MGTLKIAIREIATDNVVRLSPKQLTDLTMHINGLILDELEVYKP